jgi:hypothetical protein
LNLLLLLRGEVVFDVESLPDVFGGLALDHRGHLGAREVQQRLDVHEVCGEDELEQQILLYFDKVGVPLGDDLRELLAAQRL